MRLFVEAEAAVFLIIQHIDSKNGHTGLKKVGRQHG